MLIKKTKIDFLSRTNITTILSSVIIVIGIASLILNRGPNLSIDFTGGTIVQIIFSNDITINDIRDELNKTALDDCEIIEFGKKNEFRIKTNIKSNSSEISTILLNSFSNQDLTIRRIENVGPKIGGELQIQALYAIALALLMLMIYIGLRFNIFYSLGSVVAIVHDVLITLGIFSLLNLEIDLSIVAAFLTIVGYSLNDTIVIFDRFRENIDKDLKLSMDEIINLSLNQTLGRTVITSATTLIVVVILFLWGGEVIKYFAFALIIGVLTGTYSSIFIASPFMLYLKTRYGEKIEGE